MSFVPVRAEAQDAPPQAPPSARAVKVPEPPLVDGNVLDDPAWQSAPVITGFWQSSPDVGQPSTERTEVRVVYTSDAIYFGVICFDSVAGGLTVTESRRDSPLDDTDSFRIALDTYDDGQNGFVFGTNPAALEYDGQFSNEGQDASPGPGGTTRGPAQAGSQQSGSGGGFNLNWDGSWEVRTSTSEEGWSAEFRIPFRTLRYASGSERAWGLNFQRNIRRRKEIAYWAPLPFQFDLLRVSRAGTLAGLDLPVQRNLKLVPYVIGEARRVQTRGEDGTVLGDLGADLKYSLTPGLTLDVTYNTDFAQVEVDEQQINLDRFNLFFPEKRPFFLENAGLFAVGSPGEAELFFSRRIGIADTGEAIPIVGGARLSGKAGPVNVGLLNMQTESVPGVSPGNNFTVARVRQDFRNRSNLGAIFVGRHATGDAAGDDNHNRAFAIDGRIGIRASGMLTGFFARTATPGASDGQHAFQVQARNETQPFTVNVAYTETGEHFNPEVGFLSRTGGFRKFEASVYGRIRPDDLFKLQELRPHSTYRNFWDHDGFLQTGFWHLDNHWEFENGYEVHTGMNLTREGVTRSFEIFPGVTVPTGTYEHAEAQLVFLTDQSGAVAGELRATIGGFFGGDRLTLTPAVRMRLGETLNAEFSWARNDIDLPVGSFVTNLSRARVSYSFSPSVFVQSLVQYNDRADVWSTNFRFGWLQQANTGIFLVYTDSHLTDAAGIPLAGQTDRSFIVKISRMFDLLQ
jgi:hypothetical protein